MLEEYFCLLLSVAKVKIATNKVFQSIHSPLGSISNARRLFTGNQSAYKPAFKTSNRKSKAGEKRTHIPSRLDSPFSPPSFSILLFFLNPFHSGDRSFPRRFRTFSSRSFPRACQSTSRPRATHVAEMRARRRRRRRRIVPRKKMQQWRVLGLINSGACFGVLAVNKR